MNKYITFVARDLSTSNTTLYAYDNSFGPFLDIPGIATFDFTLLFEETILSVLPSALLLLLIPLRILHLWKAPRKVSGSYLRTTKIVLLAVFAVLQLVNVIQISRSLLRTRASLAASLLVLTIALGFSVLSYLEHTKNIRPSSIISAYLLLTLPFDAAQLRTRWLRDHSVSEIGTASGILAVKLLVLIAEAKEKRSILLTPYADRSPETTGSLYSRGLFWWLNPLFRLGFRNVVKEDDLFAADGEMLSTSLEARFSRRWAARSTYPKTHTLAWVMSRTMLGLLAASVLPRLAYMFFRFMQPLLISSITRLVSEPDMELAESRGWGLTGAIGLVFIGLAISGGAYQHKANRMTTMVRGALVSAIYTQTLDLSVKNLDESAAVTLMSSDVERICEAVVNIHNIWSSPIEMALAIWLLKNEIGLALLGPVFVTAMAISGPFLASRHMASAQTAWMEKIQTRIDVTAKMLQAIKGVKMLGLTLKMTGIVRQLRLDEVTSSLRMRKLFLAMIAFGNMSDILVPAATFIIYVIVAAINRQKLDVVSAFTALSLIQLLVAPIRAIVFSAPPLIAALGCFDRIETFISSPTRKDHRLLLVSSHSQSGRKIKPDELIRSTTGQVDIELQELEPRHRSGPPSATIRVANLTLAWSDQSSPVVADVSFDLQPGKMTMVIGPVGCGKSSLLRGLLGETPSFKGNVYIDRAHSAYVDQVPWIQNDTVRGNIVGVSIFEPEWYSKVVHACALDTDLLTLSEGDDTIVGTAGAALSGGQRLRIALARAVYSRQQVLMLDDVFSGLDATNEERIFSRLLGKVGLLRQLDTTVILVTHAAHRLSYADHIIVLSPKGTVLEQGTSDHLIASSAYVAGLAARHTVEGANVPQADAAAVKALGDDIARLNAAADNNRPIGDWATYKYYFQSLGQRNVVVWGCFMLCFTTLLRFPDVWIKFWTSAIAAHGNSVNAFYLGMLIAVSIFAMLLLMVVASMFFVFMVPRSAIYLHGKLLDTVGTATLSFFTSTDSGQIVNRFSQDLTIIDMELPGAGLVFAYGIFATSMQAILICLSAAYFAISLPFVMAIMYVLQKFYLRTSRQMRLMDLEAKAPLYTNFLETLSGLVTIRAFGWVENMQQRNMALLDLSQRPYYLLLCIQRWLALVMDMVVAALSVILVAFVVRFRHSADAGFVGVALLNMMGYSVGLSELIKNWTAIETSMGAVSRIKSFVEGTPPENLPQECSNVVQDWPTKGSITVSNLSACYALDQLPAIRDITVSIPAGQRFAICGHSGSGKSSFVALLFHMLEITEGSVIIDDIDISTIPRQLLRERLTVIPQEPIFLKGTIRQNLDPLGLAPTESTIAKDALQKVGLWSIITDAGGLDVPLEPEDLLSHGQRQLFCLARAMLRSSNILVLDEATASVDLNTDQLMQTIIREHFQHCTIIAVAHRLQTIRDFDRVGVFENGRIVELGEPDVLLADESGKFKALWGSV